MTSLPARRPLSAVAVCLGLACGTADDEGSSTPGNRPTPDTTAAALWTHLEQSAYRANWTTWPGKEEFYSGGEPHGMLLRMYLNFLARDGLTNGATRMVEGSIIVQENYRSDSALDAVMVMYKAEGYDAEHNDWFFATYDPEGNAEAAGRVERCVACHQTAPADYILTAELGTAEALGLESRD